MQGGGAKPLERRAAKYALGALTRLFVTPTPPMPVVGLTDEERRARASELGGAPQLPEA